MGIHPTAIVSSEAEIDPASEIGPGVLIEGPVRVGRGTRIHAHACLTGWTRIGERCEIYPHACIGYPPQDRAYDGFESYCVIGDDTIIREGVTIHRGTSRGSTTSVGRNCFLMANAHVAHNCTVADRVTMANAALLGGHVQVGEGTFLGGAVAVHQFVRIGDLVMVAGVGRVTSDVPPFLMAGENNRCLGLNVVGMRRAGFTAEERDEVRRAHRFLYRSGLTLQDAISRLSTLQTSTGRRFLDFLRSPSRRGIIPGRISPSRQRFERGIPDTGEDS